MRYAAKEVDDNAGRSTPFQYTAFDAGVNCTHELGPLQTEAEAGIIAFALNAIAKGAKLVALADSDNHSAPTGGDEMYAGMPKPA